MTPPSSCSRAPRAALPARRLTGSWETPGIVLMGRGSRASAWKNSGHTKSRGARVVSRTSARMAGVARKRRGRLSGKVGNGMGTESGIASWP